MKKIIYIAKKDKKSSDTKSKKEAKKTARFGGLRIIFSVVLILLLLPIFTYQILYFNKISPGINVAGINLSGLKKEDAISLLSQNLSMPLSLKLVNQGQTFDIYAKDIDAKYDFSQSVERAYNLTRSGNPFFDYSKKFGLLLNPDNIGAAVKINEDKLSKVLSVISGQDSVDPIMPSIKLIRGQISVEKGSPGKEVDQDALRIEIGRNLAFADLSNINIPIIIIDPTLSDSEVSEAKVRAAKYIGKKIDVNFEFDTYTSSDSDLIGYLNPKGGLYETSIETDLQKIISQVERDPQNPKFTFDNGRVTQFQPALDGIKVNKDAFRVAFLNSVNQIENGQQPAAFDVPVIKTPPEISTDKVNSFGINELIGRGTSTYYHSIPSRVHNVVLAASRINGTLIKPGDTFSFNTVLGDVSQFTGYQQAYIISDGKTVLGDGGGVCQVSTTLFRAALNAGLPITERTAHAYRVGYYEQNSSPGLDATVYGPSPDFKFKNDTPGYILIEAQSDPRHYSLVFELYGTSDGRVSSIGKPVISDVTSPPPDLYQDDPTLPAGTVKQVDFKAWGAKVVFNYKVTRSGETLIDRNFVSNYRPWQAIYLRGTSPI